MARNELDILKLEARQMGLETWRITPGALESLIARAYFLGQTAVGGNFEPFDDTEPAPVFEKLIAEIAQKADDTDETLETEPTKDDSSKPETASNSLFTQPGTLKAIDGTDPFSKLQEGLRQRIAAGEIDEFPKLPGWDGPHEEFRIRSSHQEGEKTA